MDRPAIRSKQQACFNQEREYTPITSTFLIHHPPPQRNPILIKLPHSSITLLPPPHQPKNPHPLPRPERQNMTPENPPRIHRHKLLHKPQTSNKHIPRQSPSYYQFETQPVPVNVMSVPHELGSACGQDFGWLMLGGFVIGGFNGLFGIVCNRGVPVFRSEA